MSAKCVCNNCPGRIEFDESSAGQIVTCPHCGLETELYVPQGKPEEKAAQPSPVTSNIAQKAAPARELALVQPKSQSAPKLAGTNSSRLQPFLIPIAFGALLVGIAALFVFTRQKNEQVIANKVVESEQALITGQIFIVTKGHANVMLGDVKVALLDAHATRSYFNSNAVAWSKALASAQSKVDQAAGKYDALYKDQLAKLAYDNKKQDDIMGTVTTSPQAWHNAFAMSRQTERYIRDLHEREKSSAEKKQFDDALETQARLWDEINWPSAGYFWPSLETTTTDSEGRFKLEVPKSSVGANMTLMAKAEREVGDGKEKYWWAVNVNLNGNKTEDFILSNHNKDSSGVWGWLDDKAMQDWMIGYTVAMDAAKAARDFQDWKDNLGSGDEK